jgi:hypothetical protein
LGFGLVPGRGFALAAAFVGLLLAGLTAFAAGFGAGFGARSRGAGLACPPELATFATGRALA